MTSVPHEFGVRSPSGFPTDRRGHCVIDERGRALEVGPWHAWRCRCPCHAAADAPLSRRRAGRSGTRADAAAAGVVSPTSRWKHRRVPGRALWPDIPSGLRPVDRDPPVARRLGRLHVVVHSDHLPHSSTAILHPIATRRHGRHNAVVQSLTGHPLVPSSARPRANQDRLERATIGIERRSACRCRT
jgi:hypothetical protein